MIAVPFIYFSGLAYFLYRKRRSIDVAILICIIYAVSGLFSILSYQNDVGDYGLAVYDISVLSAFVYCALLTICLLPFITYSNSIIKHIRPVRNVRILKLMAWLSFGSFALTFVFSLGTFLSIITGDLGAIRAALYMGDNELTAYTIPLPFPFSLIITLLNVLFSCSWILVFLAFYSLVVQKLPKKYFFLYMIASLSGPWTSVLGVDRSGFAYYILSILLIYIFFRPLMSQRLQKGMGIFMLIILGASVAFLSMVTLSRFEDADGGEFSGVNMSLFSYLGQSYPNFCYFFETFDSPYITLSLLFPFTSKYILGETIVGGTALQDYIGNLTHQSLGVFYTYLGNIMVTAGRFVMVLFCFLYYLILIKIFPRIKRLSFGIKSSYIYILGASVMVLGLFAHFYASPYRTFSCVSMLIIISNMGISYSDKKHSKLGEQ